MTRKFYVDNLVQHGAEDQQGEEPRGEDDHEAGLDGDTLAEGRHHHTVAVDGQGCQGV